MRSDSNIRTGDIATHDANAKHSSCMLLAAQSTSGANPDGRSDGSRCHTLNSSGKCVHHFSSAGKSAVTPCRALLLHPRHVKCSCDLLRRAAFLRRTTTYYDVPRRTTSYCDVLIGSGIGEDRIGCEWRSWARDDRL